MAIMSKKLKGPRKAGDPPMKKWKGKKKVKTLEDKKRKGLHLNPVDRAKYAKLEEKKRAKESLEKSVRADMEALEERSTSSMSESSFGSQPPPKKKRISFSSQLTHTKVFDKTDKSSVFEPSTATPGKSCLKDRTPKKKKDKKLKVKKSADSSPAAEKRKEAEEAMEVDEAEDKENTPDEASASVKKPSLKKSDGESKLDGVKKRKIQVPRKLKEQLLAMPRKERKAFLKQLKAQKRPHSDRGEQCKQLWEKIRSSKTKDALKEECIAKLVTLIKGHCKHFIYAHDTSRVIECLVALKRKAITAMLFDELSPELVKMSKSKYARFFVAKMLKDGEKSHRESIISAFRGHAVALARVTCAAEVLETAYRDWATPQQKFDIVSEFYGKEFVLFRTDKPRSLYQIVEEEPSKRKLIVKHLEEILMDIVDKINIKHSLTHKLLLDFIEHADPEQRDNLIDSIKDKVPELVHTAEGSRVAMHIIWNANAKDRKLIVKNFKDLVLKCAYEQYGCRVLWSIFDSVDDTVLVNKFITQEIANHIGEVVNEKWGITVAHYLVHPRDGRMVDKGLISMMRKGDENPHSKKPRDERYAELFACIANPLFTFMAAQMEDLLFKGVQTSKLVLDALEPVGQYDLFQRKVEPEDRAACYEAIKDIAAREFIPMDATPHIIEHKHAGFVMGVLLKKDASFPEEQRLSTVLATLPEETIGSWVACNKGCFMLLRMLENGSKASQQKVKKSVSVKRLQGYSNVGAKLLLDAITAK